MHFPVLKLRGQHGGICIVASAASVAYVGIQKQYTEHSLPKFGLANFFSHLLPQSALSHRHPHLFMYRLSPPSPQPTTHLQPTNLSYSTYTISPHLNPSYPHPPCNTSHTSPVQYLRRRSTTHVIVLLANTPRSSSPGPERC